MTIDLGEQKDQDEISLIPEEQEEQSQEKDHLIWISHR